MSAGYSGKGKAHSKNITNILQKGDTVDYSVITDEDKQQSFHVGSDFRERGSYSVPCLMFSITGSQQDKEHGILGCKHYQRGAKLQAHCCGKWFTCRFCHDEVSNHNIVRWAWLEPDFHAFELSNTFPISVL